MDNTNIWVVRKCRQGVTKPRKRQIIKRVDEVSVEETPLGDKFYYHLYELDDTEFPFNVNIRDDMSYNRITKERDDGLWLNDIFCSFSEEEAQKYFELECKRFEIQFGKQRYFKVKETDEVFVESNYDGSMHYANLVGKAHTTRLWDNECEEVMDYDGTPFPKSVTGYYECEDLMCPNCHAYLTPPDWATDSSKIYKLDCPECGEGFELTISVKVTYTTSTDVDAYMDCIREDNL